MTHNKILFRVDGSQDIGLGHISRCLALADMLRDESEIAFACQKYDSKVFDMVRNEEIDLIELPVENHYERDAEKLIKYLGRNTILILDGYHFRETYQLIVKPHCFKLICIDDIHSYHFYADAVVNHSEHSKYVEYSCEPYTRLYLGGKYALLRKPFLENADFDRNFERGIKNILICMGGADLTNQTLRIVQALSLTELNLTVNVVIGAANCNYDEISQWTANNKSPKLNVRLLSNLSAYEMCEQFMQNDFLFSPASTTSLEACCIGIPMIVGIIADNQIQIADILEKKQAALNLGWYKDVTFDEIKMKFLGLANNKSLLEKFVGCQKLIVDGRSEERYIKLFKGLLQN